MQKEYGKYIRFGIVAIVFSIGAYLVIGASSFSNLFIGFLLVAVSGPYGYYLWAKLNSRYKHRDEAEIIRDARNQAGITGDDDAKK